MAIVAPTYTDFLAYDSGQSAYWDTVTTTTGATRVSLDPGVVSGSLVQVQFNRTEPAGVRENVALFDLHLAGNAGGGGAWTELGSSGKGSCETALDAFWTAIKAQFSAHWILGGYVWRDWGADYPLGETGLSKPSPINRSTVRNVAATGGATNVIPDQSAVSVTFRTASRRHWGRSYLPPMNNTNYDAYGRIATTSVDTLAAAWNTMFDAMNNIATNVHPVIWSSKHRGFFAITQLAIDNVPDVIRRRRAYSKTYTKVYP